MRLLFGILFLTILTAGAQPALQHNGGMQLHEGAQVGLYFSFVNQAPFEQDTGLVGFYGDGLVRVSGSFAPVFYDAEIAHDFFVDLQLPINVANNLNFIQGDFLTDKALPQLYVALLQNAFTVGESNLSKVNGYVTVLNQSSVVFPVGDAAEYRPLTLEGDIFPLAKCGYFREDPNSPSTFPPFRTDLKPRTIEAISTSEFWRLEGSSSGQVTLTWNPNSSLGAIAEDISEIVLVGWSKSAQRWIPLGTQSAAGDLSNGFAISEPIVPDAFEILSFGSLAEPQEVLTLDNFFLSPNGDGINDVLIIEELADSPNNNLQIYDRRGLKVFEMDNYTDQFGGVCNVGNLVLNKEVGLPEGVYFYLLRMYDLDLEFQGFLFLDR
ncbi:MAG: gliding motility-associated C-terminal domain-containing protein [Bacteroidetes bacterium]|nr:MAG: gliding motility-associated C-terminal domain-containing protein [Bacteroidota bacterium]